VSSSATSSFRSCRPPTAILLVLVIVILIEPRSAMIDHEHDDDHDYERLFAERCCSVDFAPYDSSASPDCVLPDAVGKFFAELKLWRTQS
jgi:hypothetical protein